MFGDRLSEILTHVKCDKCPYRVDVCYTWASCLLYSDSILSAYLLLKGFLKTDFLLYVMDKSKKFEK